MKLAQINLRYGSRRVLANLICCEEMRRTRPMKAKTEMAVPVMYRCTQSMFLGQCAICWELRGQEQRATSNIDRRWDPIYFSAPISETYETHGAERWSVQGTIDMIRWIVSMLSWVSRHFEIDLNGSIKLGQSRLSLMACVFTSCSHRSPRSSAHSAPMNVPFLYTFILLILLLLLLHSIYDYYCSIVVCCRLICYYSNHFFLLLLGLLDYQIIVVRVVGVGSGLAIRVLGYS